MRITALKDMERGGYQGAKLWLANLAEGPDPTREHKPWTRQYEPTLYELQFGSIGTTHVLVWARSFEDALEEAASFLKDKGWVGYFESDEDMEEHYREACEELGVSWEDFQSHGGSAGDENTSAVIRTAEADLTYTESGWIPSWEWTGHEVTDPTILKRVEEAIKLEWDPLDWW